LLCAFAIFATVEAAPAWPSELGVTRHFHETQKGALHYVLRGNVEASAPLVFLHGHPRSTLEFQYLAQDIHSSQPFIAVDYYGFGASDDCRCDNATSEFVSFPKYAQEVLAILDKHGVKKFVPLGNLKGYNAAVALADLVGPTRIDHIVLVLPLLLSASAMDYMKNKFIPSHRNQPLSIDGAHVMQAWKDPSSGPCMSVDEETLEKNEEKTIDALRSRATGFQIQLAWVDYNPKVASALHKISRTTRVLVFDSPKVDAAYDSYGLDSNFSKTVISNALQGSAYEVASVDAACQGMILQNSTFLARKIEGFLSTGRAHSLSV
jgi:pimeloyl-ACP methyl ester carboxylesterase